MGNSGAFRWIALIGALALLALAVVGVVLWQFVKLVGGLDRRTLEMWAVLATLLLPAALYAGYWLGQAVQRGFLAGMDTAVGKMADAVEKIDRTVDRKVRRETPPAPNFNVLLPNAQSLLPPVRHKQLEEDETIDL